MNRQPIVVHEPSKPLLTRLLALLVCQIVVWQPLAATAGPLAQQPMFTVSSVPANVMLMMDDSSSMARYRLPTPPGLTIPGGNPSVRYNAGMRAIPAADFTLRAPAFNPLWYNPTVTYEKWNDDNKPDPAPGTSYPALANNFPNADIGGNTDVANVAQITQRDMRYRTPGQRDWISQARGTVGDGGTYAAYAPPVSQWTWNGTANPNRWEHPLAPTGVAIYPPIDNEGPQGADLFTNPGTLTCSSGPPCITYQPVFTDVCTQTAQVQIGTQCIQYQQVQQGTQQVCTTYVQVQIGTTQVCTAYTSVPTGTQTCTQYGYVLVPDATEESGFRQDLVCTQYTPDYTQVCSQYTPQPIYQQQCSAYATVPFFVDVCIATGPVFQTQCTQYTPTQTGQTCTAYDPNWTCPPQDVVVASDDLTPARYLRFQGANPNNPSDYRIIEIDRARGWTGAGRNYANPANRYQVIDPVTGLATTRPDCAAASWCTFEEEAQNFANFYAYYKNRGSAAIAVTSQAFASIGGTDQFLRIGYGRINYSPQGPQPWNVTDTTDRLQSPLPPLDGAANPGAVLRGVREFGIGSPERAALFEWLFSLNWVGSTPNREAFDGVGRYFSRKTSEGPWGDFPGTASGRTPANHLWCRRNYTLLATDGEWTRVDPGTTPPPQPLITNATPDPLGQGGGTILSSDGTMGPALTGTDKVTGSPLAYQYNPGAAIEQSYATGSSSQTATLSDVIQYYWSRDLRDDLRNSIDRLPATASKAANPAFWQHMSSFIVGYGVEATFDIALTRTAVATGAPVNWPDVGLETCRITDTDPTCTAGVPGNRINDTMRGALMSRGDFFAAASPQQLRQGIVDALQQILAENASGSALAVSSGSAAAGNLVVQASFRTDVWDGSVRTVDSLDLVNFLRGGPPPVSRWTANFPLLPVNRNIITSTAVNNAVPFVWTSISGPQQTALVAPAVLDYIRGESVSEQRFGGGFRNRRDTILGDIVNSSPLFSVNANWLNHLKPNAIRNTSPPATPDTTYRAYVQSKKYVLATNAGRVPTVLVGSNGGMLHAFDARETIHPTDIGAGFAPGKELFAYVPRGIYATLPALTSRTYVHKYYVDGQVIEGDVHFGGALESWRTVAVGSAGAGARNVFALDITDPKAFNASKVLWDVTSAEESDLGYVLGTGIIGSIRDQNATNGQGRWVYMTGNGYESTNDRAVLLLFNMQTGTVFKKMDTLAGSAGTPNGLGPVTPVYDGSRNIVAAYAGDKLGNLWRFGMTDPDPANWTIRKVFVARDSSLNPQPITTAPRVVLHPLGGLYVLFGTGKFSEVGDPIDLSVQSVYGIWDQGGTGTIPKTGPGGLVQLTLSDAVTVGLRQLDVSGLNWSTNPGGWYFDLIVGAANGERVIASPILNGGLLQVTSFAATTQGDPCVPGGISYVYRLDLASSFNQSVFLNQLPNVVGIKQFPGSVSGSGAFYIGAGPGAISPQETDANQALNLGNTGVAAVGDRASEAGACAEVIAFSGVGGSLGGVEARCQQYLPMRLFRPLR